MFINNDCNKFVVINLLTKECAPADWQVRMFSKQLTSLRTAPRSLRTWSTVLGERVAKLILSGKLFTAGTATKRWQLAIHTAIASKARVIQRNLKHANVNIFKYTHKRYHYHYTVILYYIIDLYKYLTSILPWLRMNILFVYCVKNHLQLNNISTEQLHLMFM